MTGEDRRTQNIWMVSREYGDLAGAGGVKDVVCQLAEALVRWSGHGIRVVIPLYGFINAPLQGFNPLPDPFCEDRELRLAIDMHHPEDESWEEVGFFHRKINGVDVYLVDAERYQQKTDVYVYTEEDERRAAWQKKSMGHHDYFAMNLLLQKAALELIISLAEQPDIIHCHDGHAALIPVLMREIPGYRAYFRGTGCLVTVHNAGYGYHQEIADMTYARSITGLSDRILQSNQLDDKFDPFLAAGNYAVLNTVSENYAKELQEGEEDRLTGWLGHELKERGVVLEGVTNGIAPERFTSAVVAGDDVQMLFDPGDKGDCLEGKRFIKAALLEQVAMGMEVRGVKRYGTLHSDASQPLFTFVGRISQQKGVDLLLEVLEPLFVEEPHTRMIILGKGETEYESELIRLTKDPSMFGRVCFFKGFNPEFANQVFAAGDFSVVPSRYEPCGLTDFIAQLFGSIPVVHHVGGLVKVVDNVTGLAYQGNSIGDMLDALKRALLLYGDKTRLRQMQLEAVNEIFRQYTWEKVMYKYLELYRKARTTQLCKDIVPN